MVTCDPTCVFCKIIRGEIPCTEVYRDESVLAFLDIAPLSPGHVLLVPQSHYSTIGEMPSDVAAALGAVLPRLVKAVLSVSGASGLNVLQNNGCVAGQEVDHVHIHLIPRCDGDGLGYRWHPTSYADREAEAIRDKFVDFLSKHCANDG